MSEDTDIKDQPILTNGTSSTNSTTHIQELALVGLLSVVIVVTVIGNTLVILAVLTTRRLRTVTNCFVMSLAVADWLVGVSVMPPAVAYRLMGNVTFFTFTFIYHQNIII